jgi:zinc protease
VRAAIATATPEQVSAVLKKYVDPAALNFAFVTKDGAGLRAALTSGAPSPITYATPKPPEVLAEDKRVEAFPLPMRPERVTLIEAAAVMK